MSSTWTSWGVRGDAVAAEQIDRLHRMADRVRRVAQVGDDDRPAAGPPVHSHRQSLMHDVVCPVGSC
jgi:hypothetical protein